MKRETRALERFSLSGRVVLVTGATRGLGLEIARGMAAAGATAGINGRDPARAREIAAVIPHHRPGAHRGRRPLHRPVVAGTPVASRRNFVTARLNASGASRFVR